MRSLLLLLPLLLVDGACRTPTAMTVHVLSDVPCSAQKGTIVVAAAPEDVETSPASGFSTHCTRRDDGLYDLGTIVVTPHADSEDRVGVRAVLGVGRDPEKCQAANYKGCIVGRRLLHYIPHDELTVEFVLRQECEDVECGPNSTCVERICKDADVDPTACTGVCGEAVLGAKCSSPGKVECSAGKRVTCQADGTQKVEDCGLSCSATSCGAASQVVAIGADDEMNGGTTCALVAGDVYCWGSNANQRAGAANTVASLPAPTKVEGLPRIVEIGAGRTALHVLARDEAGNVWCWGLALSGQCGAPLVPMTGPRMVADLANAAQVTTASVASCVRTNDGAVKCFGDNGKMQVGDGTMTNTAKPTPVVVHDWSGRAKDVVCVTNSCCLVDDEGQVACWGNADVGQLGDGTPMGARGVPGRVPLPVRAKNVFGGNRAFCATLEDDGVACWGSAGRNLFFDTDATHPTPKRLAPLDGRGVVSLAVAMTTGQFARTSSGVVLGWGDKPIVDQVPALKGATSLSIANAHACAVVAGAIECWGENASGQLGDGSMGHPDPAPVPWK